MTDGGSLIPKAFEADMLRTVVKQSAYFSASAESEEDRVGMEAWLHRFLYGPAYPHWAAEWEAVSRQQVHDAQPWDRARRWLKAHRWTVQRVIAHRIYPFEERDDDD